MKEYFIAILSVSHYLTLIAFCLMTVFLFVGLYELGFIMGGVAIFFWLFFLIGISYYYNKKESEEDNQEKPNKKIVIDIKLDKKNNDDSK